MTRLARIGRALRAAVLGMAAVLGGQAVAQSPDAAFAALMDAARAQVPAACGDAGADTLVRVLCDSRLRVGVRSDYPLFSTRDGPDATRRGYDVDVARALAARLGVAADFVEVRAATRISTLAEGGADVVVATMGHNTRRDGEARFVRPHYYSSETIVVGPRTSEVAGWDDMRGRRVCSTIGNYANTRLVSEQVRVMLFEEASRLPQGLLDEVCTFVSHDDSFLASHLARPEIAAHYERKFGFDRVPWGMAVARSGSADLGHALDLLGQIMHRDGVFLAIARDNGVFTGFLEEQQALWRSPACADAAALSDPGCVAPALDATQPRTGFADRVDAAVAWMDRTVGLAPDLPMLTSAPAFALFVAGIVNSLVLVLGALAATLAFALAFGFLAALPVRAARLVAWAAITTVQSSPVILTLIVAATVANTLFTYSPAVALGSAIVALGLMNGCNAGQAIGEAADSLRREARHADAPAGAVYRAAVARSLTQVLSFLVNAAKGTPIASFTGAPELLGALTDITSFAAGRATTYTIVLLFYIAVVFAVVWACERVRRRIAAREAAA